MIHKEIIKSIEGLFKTHFFGFIGSHSHINNKQLDTIKELIGESDSEIIEDFEKKYAKIVGNGECISYASGRMGFYDLMKRLGIGVGDEVILLGFTCSVMANAIIRVGATPVYSDIDPNTFGSSCISIESCITNSTKMIVAQHSFGIPCEIEKIQLLAQSKQLFLLEDCALTLGSSVNGIIVGNFGDAALFSTDHTKPLNTLTGGMIYTKNKKLAKLMRSSRDKFEDLPINKQYSLWNRLLIERKFCDSGHYGKMKIIDHLYSLAIKIFGVTPPFLSDDFRANSSLSSYPYPAKFPVFLAKLGIYEVERWQKVSRVRKNMFNSLITLFNKSNCKKYIPTPYSDPSLDIIPLRFVWSEPNGNLRRDLLSDFIHVEWTWFMRPIIATNDPLEKFGYKNGTSPISEKVGLNMINLPCNIDTYEHKKLLKKLEDTMIL
jgi:perosamine synthetase